MPGNRAILSWYLQLQLCLPTVVAAGMLISPVAPSISFCFVYNYPLTVSLPYTTTIRSFKVSWLVGQWIRLNIFKGNKNWVTRPTTIKSCYVGLLNVHSRRSRNNTHVLETKVVESTMLIRYDLHPDSGYYFFSVIATRCYRLVQIHSHTTDASSSCPQSVWPQVFPGQLQIESSVPRQSISSNPINPVPSPKWASVRADVAL